MKDHDPVHSPSHYNSGDIECIDAMRSAFHPSEVAAFCKLNAFKYIWRAGKKGSEFEDLEKALVYLGWGQDATIGNQPVSEKEPDYSGLRCFYSNKIIAGSGMCDSEHPEKCRPLMASDGFCGPDELVGEGDGETVRERALREFREGIERAGMTAYGPDEDAPSVVITFSSGINQSIEDAHSDECCMPEDCPLDCCDEASTDSPQCIPDHRHTHPIADALISIGECVSSFRLPRRTY